MGRLSALYLVATLAIPDLPPDPTVTELGPPPPRAVESVALAPTATAEPSLPPGKDRLGCRGSRSCKRLTITGIVLGVLGVGSTVTGGVLLARPDVPIADEPAWVHTTKPPGLVATTVGVGVVLTSILMIVAAQRGAKIEKNEKQETAKR